MTQLYLRRALAGALLAILASCASGKHTLAYETEGDILIPIPGGPRYFERWPHGPSADPSFFPISVWLQNPMNAERYKKVGINFFTGLHQGPTDEQLGRLASAGIPAVCDQSGVWKAHLDEPTIRGWLQDDGPDNAQLQSDGSYGPCIEPSATIDKYDRMVAGDPTRPVYLGLGRGVAIPDWYGRGSCTGRTEMYAEYVRGGDIVAFNDYPINTGDPITTVADGVDYLLGYSQRQKALWAVLEASNYGDTTRPTPHQIRAEVWMALIHGAIGVEYYCHRFKPTFSETDCLDDPPTADAMQKLDARITQLASVLHGPTVANGLSPASTDAFRNVHTMVKRAGGATYLFAIEMGGVATSASFTLRAFPGEASAEVLDEGRSSDLVDGVLNDDFGPYDVHLYRITRPAAFAAPLR